MKPILRATGGLLLGLVLATPVFADEFEESVKVADYVKKVCIAGDETVPWCHAVASSVFRDKMGGRACFMEGLMAAARRQDTHHGDEYPSFQGEVVPDGWFEPPLVWLPGEGLPVVIERGPGGRLHAK